jgi:hypothetical protein
MSAARTAERGLSTQDIQAIRDTLEAGRKPKVMFTDSAGQIAGQVGQVVQLTDPAESEDFLVVRFGKDELPFSPTDLEIPPRGAAARRPAAKPEPEPAAPEPEFKLNQPPVPSPREEKKTMSTSTVDSVPAQPAEAEPARPAAKKAARPAKPKGPAGLTVTLAYADGEWTVAAQQGTKSLAKPYVIKPAEALKMVGMLDVPGVQEAVEQIVSSERAEAQQQAERLRAELAEIEAKLADLS